MCNFIKTKVAKIVGVATGAVASASAMVGLLVTATGVTLEASDLTTLTDANTAYLTTVFQVVQLLPYIAVMAGWWFLVNKLFSIIPSSGWGR